MPKDGSLMLLVVAFLAAMVGFAAAFFLSKSRVEGLAKASEDRLADAKANLERATAERSSIQTRLNEVLPLEGEVSTLRATLATVNSTLTSLESEIDSLRQDNEKANLQAQALEKDIERQEALIRERENALERQRKQFAEDKTQLENSFASLSKQALQQAQTTFLEVAESKFKDARKVSTEEIDKILSPMKDTLGRLNEHTRELEKGRTESYSELKTQIQSLLSTTSTLSNALKRPEIRGSYGEEVLVTIAEQAGLKEGVHFTLQDSKSTEDGIKRTDMIVNVGTRGKIIIDSKTIWSAYEEASSADDPGIRAERLKTHARQVHDTITKLSRKEYTKEHGSSLEMILLFIPNEAAYHAAIREDANLIGHGFDKNVVLTSPITLFTVLRVIAEGIRKQSAYESAIEIAKVGGDLYDGVATFVGHFEGIKKGLDSASKRFDDAQRSLNRSVLSKANNLKKLGVKATKSLPESQADEELALPQSAVIEPPEIPALLFEEEG